MNEYAKCVSPRRVRFPWSAVSSRTDKALSHSGGSFCRGVLLPFGTPGKPPGLRSHDHKRQLISQGGRAASQPVLPHPAGNPLPLVAEGFAKRRNPELVNKAAGPPANRCYRTRLMERRCQNKRCRRPKTRLVGLTSIGFATIGKTRFRWSLESLLRGQGIHRVRVSVMR